MQKSIKSKKLTSVYRNLVTWKLMDRIWKLLRSKNKNLFIPRKFPSVIYVDAAPLMSDREKKLQNILEKLVKGRKEKEFINICKKTNIYGR